MSAYFRTTFYKKSNSTIYVGDKANAYNVTDFDSAVKKFIESESSHLTLSLENVRRAYPNGVLPIIITVDRLRLYGKTVYVKLPTHDNTRKLFRNVNWAYYLSPEQFDKSESIHDRHLVTRRFDDANQQKLAVDDFMDVILRNMQVPNDIISGLEWSINEITDNVLNHSNSKVGGLIQASTYPKNNLVVFAVADGGVGILKSMQEGFPNLRKDLDAIGEAIKVGVTRNPKFGQGNGLAGTLRITTMTGGSFDITSGTGRLVVTPNETRRKVLGIGKYKGTIVNGQVKITDNFSVLKALDFGTNTHYAPTNIIESQYERENEDCLVLMMKKESTGFGTRRSGYQIRTKVFNLLNAKKEHPLLIDWSGVPIISSSFADEVIGKLFLKLGAITFSARVRNIGMEEIVRRLLDKAVAQRLTQAVDE
ncbi:MAG: STAS-like domain-containing protein [Christiangramia sp.]|uniref:STAS-like domain-containing protein n=1 Tax=Christiangramia sp. TaxID=1931228 RepID=UPI003242CF69